jgi:predicted ATPase
MPVAQECNQNASVLIYVLPMYFSHALIGLSVGRAPSWPEIEASFRTALLIAREQGSVGFELRASLSLAHLLFQHGRRDEARRTLAAIYNQFTEGFDSPDLIEAKRLLDEVG